MLREVFRLQALQIAQIVRQERILHKDRVASLVLQEHILKKDWANACFAQMGLILLKAQVLVFHAQLELFQLMERLVFHVLMETTPFIVSIT